MLSWRGDLEQAIGAFHQLLLAVPRAAAEQQAQLAAAQDELLTAQRLVQAVDPAATEARRNAEATRDAARRRLAYGGSPARVTRYRTSTGSFGGAGSGACLPGSSM